VRLVKANHTVLYKLAGPNEPVQYSFDQNTDRPDAGG
jgi:hypothetical protein